MLCSLAQLKAAFLLSGGPLVGPEHMWPSGMALPWQRRASARLGVGDRASPLAHWQRMGVGRQNLGGVHGLGTGAVTERGA